MKTSLSLTKRASNGGVVLPLGLVKRNSQNAGKTLLRRRSSVLDGLLSSDKSNRRLSSNTVQHVGHWRGGGPRRRGSQEDLGRTDKEIEERMQQKQITNRNSFSYATSTQIIVAHTQTR